MRANLPTKIAVITFMTMWLVDLYVYEVPMLLYTIVGVITGILVLQNVISDRAKK